MTTSDLKLRTGGLRADLIRLVDSRSPRRWTIIDAISGRILRLTQRDWERLEAAQSNGDDLNSDQGFLAQATAAGLVRKRVAAPSQSWWTWPLRLLAFRVPLVSIDRLANDLARHCGFLFSPTAILCWTIFIALACLSVMIGWSRAEHSIAMVYTGPGSATSLGYSLAVLFVVTKCVHELGHAIACRRLGVHVGDVGLFFFCGVPCPYCDVSQVWRVDSRLQRAAVMMAGVYVELVMAAIATLIWWLTPTGPLHLLAMNTMVLCSVSTLLFNANPLMRLDGYYVLSDCLGTPNLRRQAALAWRGVVSCRIAGFKAGIAKIGLLSGSLASYHAVAAVYRGIVSLLIAGFVLSILSEWNLGSVGVMIMTIFVLMMMYRLWQRCAAVLRGYGIWIESSLARRGLAIIGLLGFLSIILCLPIRREVNALGVLDVADAIDLFVIESGWVDRVDHEFGDRVELGESLMSLRNNDLNVQLVSWQTRRTLATLESSHLKREVLQKSTGDVPWKIDQANQELVESQYATLVDRRNRMQMTAPSNGVVLPLLDKAGLSRALLDREGEFMVERTPWCRVGDPTNVFVSLRVTSKQRQELALKNVATVMIDDGSIIRISATVDLIDEIPPSERTPGDDAAFIVKCRLPKNEFAEMNTAPIGMKVEARICVEREPVWCWLRRMMTESFCG